MYKLGGVSSPIKGGVSFLYRVVYPIEAPPENKVDLVIDAG